MKLSLAFLAFVTAQTDDASGSPAAPADLASGGNDPAAADPSADPATASTASTASTPATPPPPQFFNWEGQDPYNTCGTYYDFDKNVVNKTCTFKYDGEPDIPSVFRMFVGNAAFIVPSDDGAAIQITGFDKITSQERIPVQVFWEQDADANGNLQNVTCGSWEHLTLDCDDGKEPLSGLYFMESINDHRMGAGSTFSIQLAGAEAEQTISISLTDSLEEPFSCLNFATNMGDVVLGETPNCHENADTGAIDCPNGKIELQMKTTDSTHPFTGGLVVFQCTQDEAAKAEPNLFNSDVKGKKTEGAADDGAAVDAGAAPPAAIPAGDGSTNRKRRARPSFSKQN